MQSSYRVRSIYTEEETGAVIARCYDTLYGEEFEKYLGDPSDFFDRETAANLLQDTSYEIPDSVRTKITEIFKITEFNSEFDYSSIDDIEDSDEEEDEYGDEGQTIPTDIIRGSTFNLKEALNRIDIDTYNKYDLLNLYEACNLKEDEKRELANVVYGYDEGSTTPDVIYDTLNDRYITGREIGMPERVKDGVIHEDSVNEDALNEGEYWTSDAMLRNKGTKKGMSKELETRFNDTFSSFGRFPQAFEYIAKLLGETIQFVIDECGDTQKDKEIICQNTNNCIHGGGKLGLWEVKRGIEYIQTYLKVDKPDNAEDKLEKINALLKAIFNFQTKSGSIGPAHYDPEDMAWLLNYIRYFYVEYTKKPNNGVRTDKKPEPKRPQTVSDEEVTAYVDELLSKACNKYKFSNGQSPCFFVPEKGAGVSVYSNGLAYLEVQLIEFTSRDNIEVYIREIPAEYVKDIKTFKSKCEKMILDEFEKELLFTYDGLKKVNESKSIEEDANKRARFTLDIWVPGSGGDDERERSLIASDSIEEIIETAYATDLDYDEAFYLTDWRGIYMDLDQCYDAEELEDAIYNEWRFSSIGDMQKTLGRILLPRNEVFEKDGGPFWYFTTHGVQLGSIPRDVVVLDLIEDGNWGTYVAFDKVLTTDELRQYDMIEKSPEDI